MVPPLGRTEQTHAQARLFTFIIAISTLLTVAAWVMLGRLYSLSKHYLTPGFSFAKIPVEHLWSTITATALLFVALIVAYCVIGWCILHAPEVLRTLRVAVVAGIVGAALSSIFIYPVAAIDIFYYLAELKLTYSFHHNPYQLTFLPTFRSDPLARYGWPLHVPLAYGPAWLLLARLPVLVSGFDDLLLALLSYKAWSALIVLATGLLIATHHSDHRRRWLSLHLFLGNPFIWFEAVANAHNDIIMTFFVIGAALALGRRSLVVLPLILLAAMVKIVAVVLIPALAWLAYMRLGWSVRRLAVSTLLAAAMGGAVVIPFWDGGALLTGMAHGLAFAANLKTPSLLSLTQTIMDSRHVGHMLGATRVLFAIIFCGVAGCLVWKMRDWERALGWTLLLLFTLLGSLQPWYWIAPAALFALRPNKIIFGYLTLASGLNLLIHLLDVWARLQSGLSFSERHLLGAMLLNVPLVGFLLWDASHALGDSGSAGGLHPDSSRVYSQGTRDVGSF